MHIFVCVKQLQRGYGAGNTNTTSGGGKQTLSLSDARSFKRVSQTSSNTALSGGTTVVSVKQEGNADLVPGYVDSTTFVNSPATNSRQQGSSQASQQRTNDDCEPVSLPSKCSGRLHARFSVPD